MPLLYRDPENHGNERPTWKLQMHHECPSVYMSVCLVIDHSRRPIGIIAQSMGMRKPARASRSAIGSIAMLDIGRTRSYTRLIIELLLTIKMHTAQKCMLYI
jgi:hypothetical protein